jgi:hypothetical protein
MTREQELILVEKYPGLFDDENHPWDRITGFTLQIDASGWFPIIDALCQRLSSLGGRVCEMKERVGELRVSYEGSDERVQREIHAAQEQSRTTCQICGAYGQLRMLPESLVATLCESCEAGLLQKLNSGL